MVSKITFCSEIPSSIASHEQFPVVSVPLTGSKAPLPWLHFPWGGPAVIVSLQGPHSFTPRWPVHPGP